MSEKLYNLSLLQKLSHNNEEVIRKLTRVFMEQAPKAAEDIKAAYKAEKFELLCAIAHKIKPTFGYFAVATIEKDIEMIEMLAAMKKKSTELETIISRLEVIIVAVVAEMRREMEISTTTYVKTGIVSN